MFDDATVVDLSIGIEDDVASEPFPGMGRGATCGLVDQRIRVSGVGACGFDKQFQEMGRGTEVSCDEGDRWLACLAGRNDGYSQNEKMANRDALPRQTGVPLIGAPIRVSAGSVGWVRPGTVFREVGA